MASPAPSLPCCNLCMAKPALKTAIAKSCSNTVNRSNWLSNIILAVARPAGAPSGATHAKEEREVIIVP